MDRMLYTAMTGAKQTLMAQGVVSHNLANANTTGFKTDLDAFRSIYLVGQGHNSRVFGVDDSPGVNMAAGAMVTTGRDLDVAIQSAGFIAVQAKIGDEAYTRAGDLRLTAEGFLETGAGHLVLGNSGPITIPPASKLEIGSDGTVSIVPLGQSANSMAVVDRIRMVNPASGKLAKSEDGLFRLPPGELVEADGSIRLLQGALESSNVNAAESLVSMIQLARQFELQVKIMKSAEENDSASAQLMRLGV